MDSLELFRKRKTRAAEKDNAALAEIRVIRLAVAKLREKMAARADRMQMMIKREDQRLLEEINALRKEFDGFDGDLKKLEPPPTTTRKCSEKGKPAENPSESAKNIWSECIGTWKSRRGTVVTYEARNQQILETRQRVGMAEDLTLIDIPADPTVNIMRDIDESEVEARPAATTTVDRRMRGEFLHHYSLDEDGLEDDEEVFERFAGV